jgi:starch phosphorylase
LPQRWLAIVKESIRTVGPRFCARRMVKECAERMYAPALATPLPPLPTPR